MPMLPSPIIEGTLPAFYLSEQENGAIITVPFTMSRAVNKNEIQGFRLKLKHIQGGDVIVTLDAHSIDLVNCVVKFKLNQQILNNKNFVIGNFYKAQLAYCYNETSGKNSSLATGYFSTAAIIKYTTKPFVNILGLKKTVNNAHQYEYIGEYSQLNQDFTEKEYSYRFIVKNDDKIIEDTGYLIHNSSNDTEYYNSTDRFLFSQDLEDNKKYTITYYVKTNNGLEESSPNYKIIAKKAVASTLGIKLIPKLNYQNGYIALSLKGGKSEFGIEKAIKGSFILSRASEKTNYTEWEEIDRFALAFEKPSTKFWRDFTIEQGVSYKYSLQQYNADNLYSERILSVIIDGYNDNNEPIYVERPIYADFEDSFLYDGERQLKIQFNPKISSFKKDLLETKVETIGNKFPFIFRNGNIEYKEFPISGLISYLMDEEQLFFKLDNVFYPEERIEEQQYVKLNFPVEDIENIREKTYKNNYLFYYIYNEKTRDYIRWVTYLKNLVDKKFTNPVERVYDWNNWQRWEEEFNKNENKLYLAIRKNANTINLDQINFNKTNLISQTIQLEREFKLEVLEWLTNGKPKLFKSPNEGNYLVRLMNVSLSPNDQLGRMLHTFNSTAYEVADISYNTLVQYNIINVANIKDQKYLKIVTIPLSTTDTNYIGLNTHIDYQQNSDGMFYAQGPILKYGQIAEWVEITNMTPGSIIQINGNDIMIGSTGSYKINMPVTQIIIPQQLNSHGLVTFGFFGALNDNFSRIIGTEIKDVIGKQSIGENNNITNELEDIITNVLFFNDIKIHKRPIIDTYIKNKAIYSAITNAQIGTLSGKNDSISFLTSYYENRNPLNAYQFSKDKSDLLNTNLYCRVLFEETDKKDNGKKPPVGNDKNAIYDYEQIRFPEFRTVTNPYLMDIRDFNLFVQSQQLYVYNNGFKVCRDNIFNPNTIYYIKENIEFIQVLESTQHYLSLHSYNKMLEMYEQTGMVGIDEFLSIFKPYECKIYIENQEIDVSTTNDYFTGNIGKPDIIKTTAGIYCELFYQAQIINYDISQNALLQEKKEKLDEYNAQLQQEYMIQECKKVDNNFYNEIINVYTNYKSLYQDYINTLDLYLQLLEREA